MQNEKLIARIREGGIMQGPGQVADWHRQLREVCGFRVADHAEYALMASCFNPYLEPQDMTAFRKLLDHFGVDYSLLPKEHCCGDPLYLHALDEKHEGDLERADEVTREFLDENLKQVRALGASKLVVYCAGCDMVFSRAPKDIPVEIIWHPTLLARLFRGGRLPLQADYYAGCHRYRRALLGTTPDLDSVIEALNKIDGLELNHLDPNLCCMNPGELESLTASIKHNTIITPCSGCTLFLRKALAGKGTHRLTMLSEVMWAAIEGEVGTGAS
jgi:Fe-S oxidoreductase